MASGARGSRSLRMCSCAAICGADRWADRGEDAAVRRWPGRVPHQEVNA
jgi:hypothetical protein